MLRVFSATVSYRLVHQATEYKQDTYNNLRAERMEKLWVNVHENEAQ